MKIRLDLGYKLKDYKVEVDKDNSDLDNGIISFDTSVLKVSEFVEFEIGPEMLGEQA